MRTLKYIKLFENFKINEGFSAVEYTKSTEETLKNNGFSVKSYLNGDMNQGSIAIKDRIVGYYAKPDAPEYPIKKGDPLFGKAVIWSISDNNELDKIIK